MTRYGPSVDARICGANPDWTSTKFAQPARGVIGVSRRWLEHVRSWRAAVASITPGEVRHAPGARSPLGRGTTAPRPAAAGPSVLSASVRPGGASARWRTPIAAPRGRITEFASRSSDGGEDSASITGEASNCRSPGLTTRLARVCSRPMEVVTSLPGRSGRRLGISGRRGHPGSLPGSWSDRLYSRRSPEWMPFGGWLRPMSDSDLIQPVGQECPFDRILAEEEGFFVGITGLVGCGPAGGGSRPGPRPGSCRWRGAARRPGHRGPRARRRAPRPGRRRPPG